MDSTVPIWTDADIRKAENRAYERGVQDERRRLQLLTGEMLQAWEANARRAYRADLERRRAADREARPAAPVRNDPDWPEVTQPGTGAL